MILWNRNSTDAKVTSLMEPPPLTSPPFQVTSAQLLVTSTQFSTTSPTHYQQPDHYSLTHREVALLVSLVIIGMVSACANAVVVLTISMTRKMRVTSSSYFLLSVAVADVALTGLVVPLAAYGVVSGGEWVFSKALCRVTVCLSTTFSVGSALSVAAIALDRYLAILHCLHYSVWPRWRYLSIVLTTIWTEALLFGILPATDAVDVVYVPAQYFCDVDARKSAVYVWVKAVFVLVVPLAVLVFSYAKVIHVARMHSRKIDVAAPQLRRNGTSSDSLRRTDTVTTNGAVAAGAMFSVRRLSVMSFPQQSESGGRQYHITGDLELMGINMPAITPSSEAYQTLHRSSCTSFRLILLVVVFVVCYGFHVLVSIHETFHNELNDTRVESGGTPKTTRAAGQDGVSYHEQNVSEGHTQTDFYTKNDDPTLRQMVTTASFWLTIVNSMLNPFLYAISSQRFRFFASRLFTRRLRADHHQQQGINMFDVSVYSAYLRSLHTPGSRRGSLDSCEYTNQSLAGVRVSSADEVGRRNSDSSTGTASSFLDSKQASPSSSRTSSRQTTPSRTNSSTNNSASMRRAYTTTSFMDSPSASQEDSPIQRPAKQYLCVPNLFLTDDCSLPDVEETVEEQNHGVLYRRHRSVSPPGSPRGVRRYNRSCSCDSHVPRRVSLGRAGSPDDDFVFSANNIARIRIVLDLV